MPKSASRNTAVVVCSDGNWAFQALFLLSRLRASDAHNRLDYYYYSPDIPAGRLLELINQVGCFVKSAPVNRAYPTGGHIPSAAYLRLDAINDLAQRYSRVIYLDADIFLDHGSIADLAEVPLTDRPLAAVRDWIQWRTDGPRWFRHSYYPQIVPSGGGYFNSGLLVVNSEVFCTRGIAEASHKFLTDRPELCKYHDQTALNAIVNGDWDELSPVWNWQLRPRNVFALDSRRPRLIHTAGGIKPWNDVLRLLPSRFDLTMRAYFASVGLGDEYFAAWPDTYKSQVEFRRAKKLSRQPHDYQVMNRKLAAYLDRMDFVGPQ